jgi:hypothetical protein
LAVAALAYVTFVGATFAGVPGVGRFEVAGLGALTNPAEDRADVGSDPVEQAAPGTVVGVAESAGTSTADRTSPGGASAGPTTTTPPSATTAVVATATTSVPATTTTTVHGHRGTPNSTVPDKGGPPTSRPGGH